MKMYQPRDERYLTIAHARLSFSSPPRAQTCPPSSNSHQHRLCSGVLTGGVASGSSREHASSPRQQLMQILRTYSKKLFAREQSTTDQTFVKRWKDKD